jgi:hypothetical protein
VDGGGKKQYLCFGAQVSAGESTGACGKYR